MPNVVVVRNRHRRRIADHVAEVAAEFKPIGIVPVVVVDLIAGEEQQVGFDALKILHDIGPRDVAPVAGVDRIAGERGDHNLRLVERVPPDQALVDRRFAVPHAIRNFLCHVPRLDAKRRRPTRIDDLRGGRLMPLAVPLDLQPHRARVAVVQRIQLRGQLEDVVVDRVQRKADHLILRDLGDFQQVGLRLGLRLDFSLRLGFGLGRAFCGAGRRMNAGQEKQDQTKADAVGDRPAHRSLLPERNHEQTGCCKPSTRAGNQLGPRCQVRDQKFSAEKKPGFSKKPGFCNAGISARAFTAWADGVFPATRCGTRRACPRARTCEPRSNPAAPAAGWRAAARCGSRRSRPAPR